MKSLKRFSKKQKIVALSLCALVVIVGVVLINADPFRRLEKENVLVLFSREVRGQSQIFPPKAIKQFYDSPELVQVPANFNKWELLPKVTAQMSPDGRFNIFDASCSRIDDENFLELLNTNALSQVKELELINCSNLSDESIGQIYQITNLRLLKLSWANCGDKGCKKLSSLPSLEELYVFETQVTGECFNCEGWNALETLNLDYCPISKNLFVYLAKLPRLQSLGVSYYEGIVEDLEELAARPNIQAIRINTFGLSEEEKDRLALQYAENSKIHFKSVDYRFDERQRSADKTATEPLSRERISIFRLE